MSKAKNSIVFYEHPLNERMRAFLRLEHLFQRFEHQISHGDDVWFSRVALESIIDVLTILGRVDLKAELLKELERQTATFEGLAYNPNVDADRLASILATTKNSLNILRSTDFLPGAELQQNVLLNAVRQRNSIPAGTCGFDLPSFHFWLQDSPARRKNDLLAWYSTFDVVRESIFLCLRLLRESAVVTQEKAAGGFFQRTLEKDVPLQLVRVALPEGAPWYPEISAGRHRFTIRFMMGVVMEDRPTQTEEDVEFKLLYCVI
uniref:Cell division protein ZapD n=1 Tax=Candidatus Kentrum sp. TUN TaxID=2126343 RepID=A0A450ZHY6_9GAMM|nr:MAG: cell division protein ZapD [Candidatus Kentron sp. TUN]VFK54398.1 MAG: cell division protein ZapD [Candidatus Kentron sp. TUN]VFK55478.1 MAG: cell division protein ZapD [Candidatus Kentron sp. TUN]